MDDGCQQKMEKVREALHQMGASMSVVVQQIYNVTDLCNDGQLRKLSAQGSCQSAQGSRQSTDDTAATHTTTATAVRPQPAGRRYVIKLHCHLFLDLSNKIEKFHALHIVIPFETFASFQVKSSLVFQ